MNVFEYRRVWGEGYKAVMYGNATRNPYQFGSDQNAAWASGADLALNARAYAKKG